tara:strand:+ start:7795 stop:7995 length:201 start_codon:yes stop_codon:yes gene_type:complete
MKTTWRGMARAVVVGVLLASLLANWSLWVTFKVFRDRWYEAIEAAELNDLNGEGGAWVWIELERDE